MSGITIEQIKNLLKPIENKLISLENRLISVEEKISSINEKVESIWKYNNMDAYDKYPPIMYSNSPIKLNDLGQKILDVYKGKEVVDGIKEFLFEQIDKANCKSPLDVQVMAEKVIQYNFHADPFKRVRNAIFQHPEYQKQSITPKVMFTIMGLYLRDLYLQKNKNLLRGLPKQLK